jgi:hypothetical protein
MLGNLGYCAIIYTLDMVLALALETQLLYIFDLVGQIYRFYRYLTPDDVS